MNNYNIANLNIKITGNHPIIVIIKEIESIKLITTIIGKKIQIQMIPRKKNL